MLHLNPHALLRTLFDAAVNASHPGRRIREVLPAKPAGRVLVIGAGKAAAVMAHAIEEHWGGPLEGLVVTRYGHAVPCRWIEIVEASHPVPNAAGYAAAARMLRMVEGLTSDDTVVCVFSGGGSALLPLPLDGVSLAQKQQLNAALLASGASIHEMNCLRRHVSGIKGGRLAAACHPARVINVLVSDVAGDDPKDIASGPCVADDTTCADALAIARRYQLELTAGVADLLTSGKGETVKTGDARLQSVNTHMLATPQMALQAAAEVARLHGVTPYILGSSIEGDARALGSILGGVVHQVARHGQPFRAPCVLLSGGEASVQVRGGGRGGRNVEYLLAHALAVQGLPGVYALAADTDGIDGNDEIAGASFDSGTLEQAQRCDLNPLGYLDNNDAHSFFEMLGTSLRTGPTLTNVNDFRATLIVGGAS